MAKQQNHLPPAEAGLTRNEMQQRLEELEAENLRLREQLRQVAEANGDRELNAQIAQVAIACARELRNPLMGVRMGVEYLMRGLTLNEMRRRGLNLTQANLDRIEQMVEDLLFIAPLQPPVRPPASLGQLLKAEANEVLPLLREKEATLRLDIARNLPAIPVDTDRLGRGLARLLYLRAVAVPPGRQIHLRLQAKAGNQVITLTDPGMGVPAERPEQIFEPFYPPTHHGRGLGLFLVQQVVRQHGGQIMVRRDTGGAKFTIILPGC